MDLIARNARFLLKWENFVKSIKGTLANLGA